MKYFKMDFNIQNFAEDMFAKHHIINEQML